MQESCDGSVMGIPSLAYPLSSICLYKQIKFLLVEIVFTSGDDADVRQSSMPPYIRRTTGPGIKLSTILLSLYAAVFALSFLISA